MLRFNQWYVVADGNRDDIDAELVDLYFVQKRSDDLATSHHPNDAQQSSSIGDQQRAGATIVFTQRIEREMRRLFSAA